MTDDTPNPTAPNAAPDAEPASTPDDVSGATRAGEPGTAPDATGDAGPPPADRPASSADARPHRPDYKGAELDPERGPGLGCFWFQLIVLGFFIVLIPIGLKLGWPFELLAVLLFVVIGLLLLTGQSVIFLLRLVAADRRAQGRRRPLASPTKTVGEIEDEHRVAHAVGSVPHAVPLPPAAVDAAASGAELGETEVVTAEAGGAMAGDAMAGDAMAGGAAPAEGPDRPPVALDAAPEPIPVAQAGPEPSADAPETAAPDEAVTPDAGAAPVPEEAVAPVPGEAVAPAPGEAVAPVHASSTADAGDQAGEAAPGAGGGPAARSQGSVPRRRRSGKGVADPTAPPSAAPDRGPEEPDSGVRQ